MMAISLFTSRITLQVLGVDNYGIQNVVGGFVGMFSIISSSLTNAVSRFITFEIGRGDIERLKKIFCTSMNVQIVMALIVIVALEIIGVWVLNNKLNIPDGRLYAANWVLQCSIVVFAINLICVPYNACIVGHEKMSIYAYMTLIDATLKLAIVYALYVSPYDKLISLAVLGILQVMLMRFIYGYYCKRKFEECTYHFIYDKTLFKEILSFSGWNFFGEAAWILNTQGVNMLINIFFGVSLNAARGIAATIDSAVQGFVKNFMTALNPQITKSYAVGEIENMNNLVCLGARFSCFLALFLIIPICIEANEILRLWLGQVPEYAVLFARWTLINSVTTIMGSTLVTSQFATGKIKRYQIIITICGLWVFPLTWLAFYLKMPPVSAYIIYFVVYFSLVFIRLYLVKDLIHISWKRYINEVVLTVLSVAALSSIVPLIIHLSQDSSILRFGEVILSSTVCFALTAFYVGMKKNERQVLLSYIKSKIKL